MTREEFEAKRSEGLSRCQEWQENAKARDEKYQDKSDGFSTAMRFLNSIVGGMAKSMERQLKNMK